MIASLLFVVLALWVCAVLARNFALGLCSALGLFVSVPISLILISAQGIPALTFLRFVVIVAFLFWLGYRDRRTLASVPFLRLLVVLVVASSISMVFSVNFGRSLKDLLSLVFEVVVFYFIVSTVLTERETIRRALWAIGCGLAIVAILAGIEKYTGINPAVNLINPQTGYDPDGRGVWSTYPHRILLGYAMAMGFVIGLAMLADPAARGGKILRWALLIFPISACYFSGSRGPWAGSALGGAAMFLLGGKEVRRLIMILLGLTVAVAIIRPGVRDTITHNITDSFDDSTLQGRSAHYRWTLWHVAWSETTKSPVRFLFGYGGQTTETMDLHDYFEHEMGGTIEKKGFTSWDSQFASDFMEFGLVGLMIDVVLYGSVLLALWRAWQSVDGPDRTLVAAALGCVLIYLWGMTNVAMYSPQLKAIFWTIIAIGTNLARLPKEEALLEDQIEEAEDVSHPTVAAS